MRTGLLATLLILTSCTSALAGTIHVPTDYEFIQDAVDAALFGDVVLVAAGVFDDLRLPPGADTTRCVVNMKSGITLQGAGIGQTIIDPNFGGRGIQCVGVTDTHIEGLTVRRAHAEITGAGLYCTENSSPTVTQCEFTECTDGGIICLVGSSPDLLYCLITNNESKSGGGIAAEDGSSPHLTHCTITGNSAPAGGGVFVRAGSSPLFEYTIIADNFLNTDNGAGGGVDVISAELTLFNCDVIDNVASGPGGGLRVIDGGTLVLVNCNVLRNSTTDPYGPGGGIHCEAANLEAYNTLIADNWVAGSGSDGGGVNFFFMETEFGLLQNCTIVGNEVSSPNGHGAGVACFLASPSIEKTILASNLSGMGLYCVEGSSIPQVTCCDLYGNAEGDGICGNDVSGNFSLDPQFCDPVTGNYSLQSGSPCLPGNHPNGDECGLIGAFGSCDTGDVPEWIEPAALLRHYVYPNPFGLGTEIHFVLEAPAQVRLTVYDPSGRQVRVVEDGSFSAGEHSVRWDSRDNGARPVRSGLYFYRLDVDGRSTTGRLVLAR